MPVRRTILQMNNTEVHIGAIETTENGHRVATTLQIGRNTHAVYVRSDNTLLSNDAGAFLVLALLPCMKTGSNLVVESEISGRLLSHLETIQDIYCSWHPSLRRVRIQAPVGRPKAPPEGNRVATCFSAGVDSFYTLLKHRDEITDLVFVHGWDIDLEDRGLRRRSAERVRAIGAEFGKQVIELETNVGPFLCDYMRWGDLGHGAAIASAGLLLSALLRKIYIPSSHTYAHLFPWGTHPILDPLWSTETLEFVHDGCEATRLQKVAKVAESDTAIQGLRVCLHPPEDTLNCGRCEKCVRTMIELHVAGVMDRCTAFGDKLTPESASKIIVRPDDVSTRAFIQENLDSLEARGQDHQLCDALRKALHPGRPWWQMKILRETRRILQQAQRVPQKASRLLRRSRQT